MAHPQPRAHMGHSYAERALGPLTHARLTISNSAGGKFPRNAYFKPLHMYHRRGGPAKTMTGYFMIDRAHSHRRSNGWRTMRARGRTRGFSDPAWYVVGNLQGGLGKPMASVGVAVVVAVGSNAVSQLGTTDSGVTMTQCVLGRDGGGSYSACVTALWTATSLRRDTPSGGTWYTFGTLDTDLVNRTIIDGVVRRATSGLPTPLPAPCTTIRQLAAGMAHVVAIAGDGAVYAWGRNTHGQAGPSCGSASCWSCASGTASARSDGRDVTAPRLLPGVGIGVDVSCGRLHTLLRSADGGVFAWGNNNLGQLGVVVPTGSGGSAVSSSGGGGSNSKESKDSSCVSVTAGSPLEAGQPLNCTCVPTAVAFPEKVAVVSVAAGTAHASMGP